RVAAGADHRSWSSRRVETRARQRPREGARTAAGKLRRPARPPRGGASLARTPVAVESFVVLAGARTVMTRKLVVNDGRTERELTDTAIATPTRAPPARVAAHVDTRQAPIPAAATEFDATVAPGSGDLDAPFAPGAHDLRATVPPGTGGAPDVRFAATPAGNI